MLASELARPQGWEFLEVAWDSEGAQVLEILPGVLAVRMEHPCMGSYRSRIPPKERGDGNAPLSKTATSCHLLKTLGQGGKGNRCFNVP